MYLNTRMQLNCTSGRIYDAVDKSEARYVLRCHDGCELAVTNEAQTDPTRAEANLFLASGKIKSSRMVWILPCIEG
jgi:hypothetical protein